MRYAGNIVTVVVVVAIDRERARRPDRFGQGQEDDAERPGGCDLSFTALAEEKNPELPR